MWWSVWCVWFTENNNDFKITSFIHFFFVFSVLLELNLFSCLSPATLFFVLDCDEVLAGWRNFSSWAIRKWCHICFHFCFPPPHISSIIYVAMSEVCDLSHNNLIYFWYVCPWHDWRGLTRLNMEQTLWLQLWSQYRERVLLCPQTWLWAIY